MPRGRPSGAVDRRAGQAEKFPLHRAGLRVVHKGRGAAQARHLAVAPVVQVLFGQFAQPLVVVAKGTGLLRPAAQFVVAHQNDAALWPGESGHPVGCARHPQAVVHRIAGARENPIAKSLGQIEDASGVGHERPKAIFERWLAPSEVAMEAGKADGNGDRAFEELASRNRHEIVSDR